MTFLTPNLSVSSTYLIFLNELWRQADAHVWLASAQTCDPVSEIACISWLEVSTSRDRWNKVCSLAALILLLPNRTFFKSFTAGLVLDSRLRLLAYAQLGSAMDWTKARLYSQPVGAGNAYLALTSYPNLVATVWKPPWYSMALQSWLEPDARNWPLLGNVFISPSWALAHLFSSLFRLCKSVQYFLQCTMHRLAKSVAIVHSTKAVCLSVFSAVSWHSILCVTRSS